MAGKPREPIALLKAKGKKHLTKDEIKNREKSEVNTDNFRNVKPPSYLSAKQKKAFKELAEKLIEINIMSELDEDALARYFISKENYLRFTKIVNSTFKEINSKENKGNIKLQLELSEKFDKYLKYQDNAFKQCRVAANDMGLTITSRAKIVLPQGNDPPKPENKFLKFYAG